MAKSVLVSFFVFFVSSVFSQIPGKCPEPREIRVDMDGIHPVSAGMYDTLVTDPATGLMLHSYPDGSVSTWYRIHVKQECEIHYAIREKSGRQAYFYLYELDPNISLCEVQKNKFPPVRGNLFAAQPEVAPKKPSAVDKDASVHGKICALPNMVYVLNILHSKEEECGHSLTLRTSVHFREFESLSPACYEKRSAELIPEKFIRMEEIKENDAQLALKKSLLKESTALILVLDSANKTFIPSEISFAKNKNNTTPQAFSEIEGKHEFILEKNLDYKFVISALGYKPAEITIRTSEEGKPIIKQVEMIPLKAGENFTMDKIYFYPNTAHFRQGSTEELEKLEKYLKSNPVVCVEIQGHTNGKKRIRKSYDSGFSGSAKKLSLCRAEKIKKHLLSKGIAPDRLRAAGYGGAYPVFPKPKNQAQANKNIRVEVLILSYHSPESARKNRAD